MHAQPLPTQADDFPAWYGDVVRRAGLAENGPVRGTMIVKPYGHAIWEAVQQALDQRIKATGHDNVAFPLLVPAAVLAREGELLAGFAPEVYEVSRAGGRKLEEPLVIRPTSEAIIWATYARWVQSWRDLPLLCNQWGNVMRYELRPRLFLRTCEFFWQEGHTAHASADEAVAETLMILHDVYADVAESVLAMPVLRGRKSASQRFPGADETYALEALMRDGKALQAATAHYLGDRFARAFDVTFTDRDGSERHPFGTSWGASTRLVGGVILTHGDDAGLRLPPAIAPHQAVIVPIQRAGEDAVGEAADAAAVALRSAGVRVHVDRRDARPGFKFADWELRGAPLRIEIGPRDVARGEVTVVRRDDQARELVPLSALAGRASHLLDDMQAALLADATAFREAHTLREPASYDELREFLQAAGGFAVTPWCGSPACEERVKADTRASIRCLPVEQVDPEGTCTVCGVPGTELATWAQAY